MKNEVSFISLLKPIRSDITLINSYLKSLQEDFISSKVNHKGRLKMIEKEHEKYSQKVEEIIKSFHENKVKVARLESDLKYLKKEIHGPKEFRSMVIRRVVSAILISITLGSGAFIAELLYHTHASNQKQILHKIKMGEAKKI